MNEIIKQIDSDLNGYREMTKLSQTYLKQSKNKFLSVADRNHYYYKYLKCKHENEMISDDIAKEANQLMPLLLRIEIEDMVTGYEI